MTPIKSSNYYFYFWSGRAPQHGCSCYHGSYATVHMRTLCHP